MIWTTMITSAMSAFIISGGKPCRIGMGSHRARPQDRGRQVAAVWLPRSFRFRAGGTSAEWLIVLGRMAGKVSAWWAGRGRTCRRRTADCRSVCCGPRRAVGSHPDSDEEAEDEQPPRDRENISDCFRPGKGFNTQ